MSLYRIDELIGKIRDELERTRSQEYLRLLVAKNSRARRDRKPTKRYLISADTLFDAFVKPIFINRRLRKPLRLQKKCGCGFYSSPLIHYTGFVYHISDLFYLFDLVIEYTLPVDGITDDAIEDEKDIKRKIFACGKYIWNDVEKLVDILLSSLIANDEIKSLLLELLMVDNAKQITARAINELKNVEREECFKKIDEIVDDVLLKEEFYIPPKPISNERKYRIVHHLSPNAPIPQPGSETEPEYDCISEMHRVIKSLRECADYLDNDLAGL